MSRLECEYRLALDELYAVSETLDVCDDRHVGELCAERDRLNGRLNALEAALSCDDCTPAGQP